MGFGAIQGKSSLFGPEPIIVTVPVTGWKKQTNGSFTQSVAVPQLLATDDYRTMVMPVGNKADPAAQALTDAAYALMDYVSCDVDGQLYLRCKDTKPTINFQVAVVITR